MTRLTLAALAATAMLFAAPVAAQDVAPFKDGSYWSVTGIHVKDGSGLTYANHLAKSWVTQQEWSKSKGYSRGYHVLANENPREGEPHVYLVTIFDKRPDGAEAERRGVEYRASMKTTMDQMEAESGKRADYRTVGSNMLLVEQMKR